MEDDVAVAVNGECVALGTQLKRADITSASEQAVAVTLSDTRATSR